MRFFFLYAKAEWSAKLIDVELLQQVEKNASVVWRKDNSVFSIARARARHAQSED